MSIFNSFYIEDPDLIFSNMMRINDPRAGLYLYGPYGKTGRGENKVTINVGIIGSADSISQTLNFLDAMKKRITSNSVGGVDFPGLGLEGRLRFEIKPDEQWTEIISTADLDGVKTIPRLTDRILACLDLIQDRMFSISQKVPLPDVVFIPIPKAMVQMCQREGQIGERITISNRRFGVNPSEDQLKGDYNFHNIVKVIGIKYSIPTQIILPRSLDLGRSIFVQDLAQRAWNVAVAVYYKNKGVPWKLSELDPDTCYAGITFYRELDESGNPTMRAAAAQVFLHTGESLVLRGNPFYWGESRREPRLSAEQAISIRDKIIDAYVKTHKKKPRRLILHKSTIFNEEEINGITDDKNGVEEFDLLSIRSSMIDFYRDGNYPIPRGIVISPKKFEYYLFTLGFIPQLKTFTKPGIPKPIQINAYHLDSPDRKMCKEILSLSKLNWNNADFCDQLPITLTASYNIGDILSEARARNIDSIPSQYMFYM